MSKPLAIKIAANDYEKLELHLLSPEGRSEELSRQLALLHAEAESFDRPLYISQADNPRFLVKHFACNNHFFSNAEKGKYQQAILINEKTQLIQRLLDQSEIMIEKQALEEKMSIALINGQNPDSFDLQHLKYLEERFQAFQHKPANALLNNSKTLHSGGRKKKWTFGFHGIEELLSDIVDELVIGIQYLRWPTTTADFIKVVTSPDLTIVDKLIYQGCTNNQVIYSMDWLDSMFLSFDIPTIGNSRLFISKSGNILTGHNLGNTPCVHVPKRHVIDAIFNKYKVKWTSRTSKFNKNNIK